MPNAGDQAWFDHFVGGDLLGQDFRTQTEATSSRSTACRAKHKDVAGALNDLCQHSRHQSQAGRSGCGPGGIRPGRDFLSLALQAYRTRLLGATNFTIKGSSAIVNRNQIKNISVHT